MASETIADLAAAFGIDIDGRSVDNLRKTLDNIANVQIQSVIDKANQMATATGKAIHEVAKASHEAAAGGIGEVYEKLRNFWLIGKAMEGFSALKHTAEHAIELGANMGDLADKTGLALDKVQELAYTGEVFGLSANTMATTVNKLAISLDSAASGGGETADAFRKAGIAIKDATGKARPAGEVLLDIADHMKKVYGEDPSKAPAEAMKLLGKSGKEMIPLLKEGSEKFAELSAEAHEFGRVLDKDTVDAMDRVSKNTKRLSAAWEGIKEHAIAALIPEIEKLTGSLIDWYKANSSDINEVVHQAFHLILIVVKGLAKAMMTLVKIGAFFVKNWKFVLILLGSLGYAFIALQGGAIAAGAAMFKSGLKAAAGWIAAAAPLIALTAIITGVVLLIEDFYGWMNGKDSLLGRKFGKFEQNDWAKGIAKAFDAVVEIVKWIVGKVEYVVKLAVKAAKAVTGGYKDDEKFVVGEAAFNSVSDQREQALDALKKNPSAENAARVKELSERYNLALKERNAARNVLAEKGEAVLTTGTPGLTPDKTAQYDAIMARTEAQQVQVQQVLNLTVNGGDPAEIRRVVEETQAKNARQLEATIGGGKKK